MQVAKLTDKEKQKRITLIEIEIEKITSQIKDPSNPIHSLYSKKSPKKDLIIDWANYLEQLHELGRYDEPIFTISSYIKKELSKMGLTEATHYVHEVLPFKYKQENKMNYQNEEKDVSGSSTQNSSEEELRKIRKENSEYISMLDETIEFFEFVKDVLNNRHFVSLLDQEELEEFYLVQRNAIAKGKTIFNDKKKDMIQTQSLLVECVMHANTEHAAGVYMERIKDMFQFTGKQAGKILRGLGKDLHPLYDPKNRHEAMFYGFSGQRCNECGSWRVGIVYDGKIDPTSKQILKCYHCKSKFDFKTEYAIKALRK